MAEEVVVKSMPLDDLADVVRKEVRHGKGLPSGNGTRLE